VSYVNKINGKAEQDDAQDVQALRQARLPHHKARMQRVRLWQGRKAARILLAAEDPARRQENLRFISSNAQ